MSLPQGVRSLEQCPNCEAAAWEDYTYYDDVSLLFCEWCGYNLHTRWLESTFVDHRQVNYAVINFTQKGEGLAYFFCPDEEALREFLAEFESSKDDYKRARCRRFTESAWIETNLMTGKTRSITPLWVEDIECPVTDFYTGEVESPPRSLAEEIKTIRYDLEIDPEKIYFYRHCPQYVWENGHAPSWFEIDHDEYFYDHVVGPFSVGSDWLKAEIEEEASKELSASQDPTAKLAKTPVAHMMVEMALLMQFPHATILNPQFGEKLCWLVRESPE